ncbi:thioredoxin family protein [Foetidibacter luteolus]|uniref:thioredoxin family protein n=1 Tax=Foetidibacter luteolus TaxID=2608880 RepID=UPI00129AF45F|nr:thioredoxin family protein [Foetidibacter luteolus]
MSNALKRFFATAISLLFLSKTYAQNSTFEIIKDDETKVLKGILKRSDIEADTAFRWFKQNYDITPASAVAVDAFKKNASKFQVVVFGGTWCHDTQYLLPLFYRLADSGGLPDSAISLIGVDREKTASGHLEKAFNVLNVPTFIVMKDGKEIGRVVEYGKEGEIDKELGAIVAGIQ